MTVVRGIIREIGRSTTTRISARRWYGSTTIIVQDEETGQTYSVKLSARVMDRCKFLPRVGMPVIIHGFVEEAEYGLSDFVVTRVTDIRHEGAGIKRRIRLDEE
ncbi:MAG: hypothetical protein DRO73_02045 [Candidatus Thorarchaeota archaeon]|nr:MAG: hypothetical protein DRO73_02045 [Candidatus Thorarchaeota archaeon]